MSRYIDADGAKKAFLISAAHELRFDREGEARGLKYAASLINYQPTEDVAPVVHAHWEYHESVCTDEGIIGGYVCSACKAAVPEAVFDFFMEGFHKDFCGSCGAKMDAEEEPKK